MAYKSYLFVFFILLSFNSKVSAEVLVNSNENTAEKSSSLSHDVWTSVLQKYVSATGEVDYKGLKSNSSELYDYIYLLKSNPPQKDWTREEQLAYWINAYNVLTIDLILRNHPLESIRDISNPWDQELWKIGDETYSLNEIEHQILRKMNEPRIHFAIVCASVSCPKLQQTAFTASELDLQLTKATREFLSDASKNKITENQLKLSKIFKWFTRDFKTPNTTIIDFVNRFTDIVISDDAEIDYMEYNWNLND